MTEIPIYLEIDEEIEDVLASSGMNIREILHNQNIKAKVTYGPMPIGDEAGVRTRDVVTIISASAAAAFLISKAITNILKEIHRKPIHDEYFELVPSLDSVGNPVRDEETGEILMTPKKIHFVHEFGNVPSEDISEVNVGPNGIVMRFSKKQEPKN